MALRGKFSPAAKTLPPPPARIRTRPLAAAGAVPAAALALSAASTGAAAPSTSAPRAAATAPMIYGTLDSQASAAATEAKAGVSMAMFELNWASFEPQPGVVSASYLATMRSFLAAYQAAGQRVTLGLGLQNPPPWVFSLPNATYVDQNGQVSTEADFVYSQAVRQAAGAYLALVAANLPLSNFWAIRITSGGDGESLYPGA